MKVADLRLYQCREQAKFEGTERRQHPRFAMNDTNVRVGSESRTRPLVNVSYGGLAFRARRAETFSSGSKGEKGEIVRLPFERREVRLRAMHSAPMPGGAVRVGCRYF